MGKLNQNLIIFKSDILPIDFLHVGPFWATQGQVLPIQLGDVAEWRMFDKDNPAGTVYITKKSTLGEITYYSCGFFGTTDDTIRVQLASLDTSTLTVGEYSHELIMLYEGTKRIVVAQGVVTLKQPRG